jgi:hypothetical protein
MRSSNAEQLVPSVSRVRCVVVEQGAPPFLPGDAEDFDETVVVAQLVDERPEVFAQRMLARLAWAARSGKVFRTAIVVTKASASPESLAARRRIVLAFAAHAEANGGMVEIALRARSSATLEERFELLGLVEEVLGVCRGSLAPVRLRFGESIEHADERSGVFHVSEGRGR